MRLESSGGMQVELSDEEYGKILAEHGTRAKEISLTRAGRVYKHRELLKLIHEQKLTDEQKSEIKSLAKSLAIQTAIDNKIIEMGYASYILRRDRGGMMPESWHRTVETAKSKIDVDSINENDFCVAATAQLGFYIDEDEKYSAKIVSGCDWKISVPEGWGGSAMKNGAPLGFDIH